MASPAACRKEGRGAVVKGSSCVSAYSTSQLQGWHPSGVTRCNGTAALMGGPGLPEGCLKPGLEGLRPEPLGPLPDFSGIQLPPDPLLLEPAHRFHQRPDALVWEEHTRGLFETGCGAAHRVQQATTAESDHRGSCCHRLNRGDTEILQPRIHKRPTGGHQRFHLLLALAPQQSDRGTRQGFQALSLGAVTHHHQRQTQAIEGFHHQIHPLVGHQTAEAEIDVVARCIPAEALHGNRWVQHLGLTSPELLNAPGGEAGIRQQVIDPLGAELVPLAQGMQLPADQRAKATTGQCGSLQIGVHLIPCVADRGVHIAQMQLLGRGKNPLGHKVAAADHQLSITKVDLFNRHWQQRQVLLHMADTPGQLLDEAGANLTVVKPAARPGRLTIHQRSQLRHDPLLSQQGINGLHHQFRAASGPWREPFVGQDDALGKILLCWIHRTTQPRTLRSLSARCSSCRS